jgi:hypothetical protein
VSIVQVRQIKGYLEAKFGTLIDMTDWTGKPANQIEGAFLSRGVAALTLMHLAGISCETAVNTIVDGYNDNGIDAVYFDPAERLLYVIQSKWDGDGTGSVDLGEAQKFTAGVRDLIHPRLDRFNSKVQARASEINEALSKDGTKVVLVLAYTGSQTLSTHVNTAISDLLTSLNDTGDVASFEPMSQKELYAAITALGESIDLEVMIYEWAKISEPFTAYYGQVKAVDVALWWSKWGVRLLSLNLRNFIGASDVNSGMIETLTTAPENFWYFNNGITVLCGELSKKLAGGADRTSGMFDCKKISIVNGAQTVGSIAQAQLKNPAMIENAKVMVRFISLEHCPDGFGVEVTRAANTQNRIETRDFAALDPQQERLRIELLVDEKKQYIYKTGAYSVSPDDGCTIDEAAVSLACAQADIALTVQAKREISKLYENIDKAPYKLLFNAQVSAKKMWRSVLVQRAVDAALREKGKSLDDRSQMVAVHGNRFILHEVLNSLVGNLADAAVEELKSPASALANQLLTELALQVEKYYPGSYLNSLFKNAEKCRHLSREVRNALSAPTQISSSTQLSLLDVN